MKIATHDVDTKVFIIAEIGNNHEGDFGLAKDMIAAATEAGADAVKFQTIRADKLVDGKNYDRLRKLRTFELTDDQFVQLADAAEQAGVVFLSTPFDIESARFLNDLVPAFKIASGDLNFAPLLDEVAGFGKPLIMSRGVSGTMQIHTAVGRIKNVWKQCGTNPGLALLHCVSQYPTSPEEANLSAIAALRREFNAVIGYSDHTLGIEAAVLSVALGARIVEKHFTIDHDHSPFRDHQLSADPREMAELVCRIREAEIYLGKGNLEPDGESFAGEKALTRSICTATDLPAGTILVMEQIAFLRPGGGITPEEIGTVLGKRTKRDLAKGDRITSETLS